MFQLSLEEHIQLPKKELFVLHAHQQEWGTCTWVQKAHNQEPVAEAPVASNSSAPAPTTVPRQPEAIATKGNTNHTLQPPIHPFTWEKDATYSLPTTDNVAAKPKPPPKKPDGSYKTTTSKYDPKVASDVYVCMMDSQITLTHRKLLLLLPEVWNQVWEATTNHRAAQAGAPATSTDKNLLDMLTGMEVDDGTDQAQHKATWLATMLATYQATVHTFMQETPRLTFSNT